uniref:NACHT domain-containing protein n=1 Tax=Sphenodon punctatus TaxID=8508 RepID=A0A8D0G6K1_SPHPU
MAMPSVFKAVCREKDRLLKARELCFSPALLLRYRQALEAAIQISARHNVPPIPGRILILVSVSRLMNDPYQRGQELCCPSTDQGDEATGKEPRPITSLEVALLLAGMARLVSEQARLVLYGQGPWKEAAAATGSLLADVQAMRKQAQAMSGDSSTVCDVILDLVARRKKVETILVLSHSAETSWLGSSLQQYRQHVAPGCCYVNVCATPNSSLDWDPIREVILSGFSEQVLRFVSACGTSRLLEHVDRMDKIHGLPEPQGAAGRQEQETGPLPLLPAPRSRWRSVRIFISSTFRDMHGERDLLLRSVFPELRARAAPHCLALEEIDLRWGITEQEAKQDRQLQLCLSEVARSHLFVGILGERYGHVPHEYSLPDEPHYQWITTYPLGRSVTELEAMQFLFGSPDPSTSSQAFFYLREPGFLGSVPDAWQADFAAESEEATLRMSDLKGRLRDDKRVVSLHSYSCQWGGVAQGRPYVKGLEEFGAKVLQDLWGALRSQFLEVEQVPPGIGTEEQESLLQEDFQEFQQRQFCAREKLLQVTAAQLQRGRVYVVSGESGQGKTVFMAALGQELQAGTRPHRDAPNCYQVVSHFTGARPDQANAHIVLSNLCALLSRLLEQPPRPPGVYRVLVSRFETLLHKVSQSLRKQQALAVLIDGADLIHAASGQLVSDWLPEKLPKRVSLVLSVCEDSALLGSLKRRRDVVTIPLGPLDPPDRAGMVRRGLALYGKKLEETPFNNQMRPVLLKRGSRQPLYLMLLTQDLRAFAVYEKVTERIQKLPASLPLLLQHVLSCLEQVHGADMVAMALTALWVSRDGLMERDLHSVLGMWQELREDVTWEAARDSGSQILSYPVATFLNLMWSLKG